jgi:hypothetical protein
MRDILRISVEYLILLVIETCSNIQCDIVI